MKRSAVLFVLSLALSIFFAAAPKGALAANCAECGMMVDLESKFCAKIVQDGKTLLFCDIGDLLTHLNKKSLSPDRALVRDYKTGEWITADKAFYVHADKAFKTPMGWGIAAFKNRDDAAAFGNPLDLTVILRAVR
jgi:copper chaperone NosL